MAHSYHHAVSSARRYGGVPEDYLEIHNFLDSSKAAWADHRHRAVLHHSYGIFITEQMFGLKEETRLLRQAIDRIPGWLRRLLRLQVPATTPVTIRASSGRDIPIRLLAEQHVLEDCGFIPALPDYLGGMPKKTWMARGSVRLSSILERGGKLPVVPEGGKAAGGLQAETPSDQTSNSTTEGGIDA